MNILFLTMSVFTDIEMHSIYSDLMKEFIRHGHRPYIVTPREKKMNQSTELVEDAEYSILKVKVGNTSNVSLIEKGISTITLASSYYNAVKKYLGHLNFRLILYSTPPITLASPVQKLKKYYKCTTYLMLKDIFPQNAVDLGMFSRKGFLYKFFRNKEKRLYAFSDYIGCMSQANVDYVLKHNPEIDSESVEICPNSIEIIDISVDASMRKSIRTKYGIPLDKKVFIYGGNLGKPQGISFLIECLDKCRDVDTFFLIVGDGTEYGVIEECVNSRRCQNVKLMKQLPKEDYDTIVGACDVGMIFLDHRFTIPNFPSRLLSYMQARLPVLAVTDSNTDIGKVITEGGFGWSCESNDVIAFYNIVIDIVRDTDNRGEKAFEYLKNNYSSKYSYQIISSHF